MIEAGSRIEVCVADIESALAAYRGGAHRLELCDNLYEGGTTPSQGMIRLIRKKIKRDIYVMIRPRGGDFYYSDDEFEVMLENIKSCREMGVDGVVLGCLKLDGSVNITRTKQLVEQAWPMSVTFHRAFDLTSDPLEALEAVIDCGVDRILTSGQQNTALEGAALIGKLIAKADNRVIIMPGGGINDQNILELKMQTGAQEFHLTGKTLVNSPMIYRKDSLHMGSQPNITPYQIYRTDEALIKRIALLL